MGTLLLGTVGLSSVFAVKDLLQAFCTLTIRSYYAHAYYNFACVLGNFVALISDSKVQYFHNFREKLRCIYQNAFTSKFTPTQFPHLIT